MENLNLDQIGTVKPDAIGFNRYSFLMTLQDEDLTDLEKQQIEAYNELHNPTYQQKENLKTYLEKIRNPEIEKEFEFTKKTLWIEFLKTFKELNKVDFIQTPESLANIKTLFFYFLKDDQFLFCENVSSLSKPSFDKGLLIIGNFGNGKTSVMLTFEKIFKGLKNYSFKSFTANEVVNLFESIGNDINSNLTKMEFEKKMNHGSRYFDDVKTERHASNFGKVNLFKDILETREKNLVKTYLTANFKEGFPDNVSAAIDDLKEIKRCCIKFDSDTIKQSIDSLYSQESTAQQSYNLLFKVCSNKKQMNDNPTQQVLKIISAIIYKQYKRSLDDEDFQYIHQNYMTNIDHDSVIKDLNTKKFYFRFDDFVNYIINKYTI
jgi:DNA replication protein DnaC